MANIQEIKNDEVGLSVRNKLNAIRVEANKVEGIQADLTAEGLRIDTNALNIATNTNDIGVLETEMDSAEGRLDNLEENQVTGVEVYQTLVDEGGGFSFLPVTGTVNVSYKVANDPDPTKNGYYSWDGAAYVKDNDPTSEIQADIVELETDMSEVNGKLDVSTTNAEFYLNASGDLAANASYNTLVYEVTAGDIVAILGRVRGSNVVSAYGFYTSNTIVAANVISLSNVSNYVDDVGGAYDAFINDILNVPVGALNLAVCYAVSFKPFLYAYEYKNIDSEKTKGDLIEIDSISHSEYLNSSGDLAVSASYLTRIYKVTAGSLIGIKGANRGGTTIGCFAFYTASSIIAANLHSIKTIGDFEEPVDSNTQTFIDITTKVPESCTYLAVTSVHYQNPQLLAYQITTSVKYIEDKVNVEKYINTVGDSLTMGDANFGWYQDTLKELCGDRFYIRNLGVGGEKTSTIMARMGAVGVIFPNDFTLPADTSTVQVADGTTADYLTSTLDANIISPLLQGASNDGGQRTRVVNPCYINGIKCNLTRVIEVDDGLQANEVSYHLARDEASGGTVDFKTDEPLFFNTGKYLGNSDITIIWMGTNGAYTDFADLVNQHKIAVNQVPNKKYIIIGLHLLTEANGQTYEGLMVDEFGNKFFNIRQYASTNMIYDAGITPSAQDLTDMGNGLCPAGLLYDSTHFLPASNVAIGTRLYNMMNQLGYLD